jgi:hypothetical protein
VITSRNSPLESQAAQLDSVMLTNDSDSEERDEFDGDNTNRPKSELLLDPKCRPKWISDG